MARKPNPTAEVVDVTVNEVALQQDVQAANQLAQLVLTQNEETATRVRAVAQTLGYQLPADATDPDLIQRDIAANMRRSVEACLEVGRGLRVLKEACEHGQFMLRLEALGIDKYVASRFMQSAAKFSKLPSNATLKAIGNQTKLFEMLVLDDEQIEELELTGQTGELKLDDIATMSVKELRAALREERQERAADQQVSDKKTQRIDALERKLVAIERSTPDQELIRLKKEATSIATETEAMVLGSLRQALIAMNNHGAEHGQHTVFMAGLLGQVQAQLTALREEFNLPDVSNAAEVALAAEVAQWAQ